MMTFPYENSLKEANFERKMMWQKNLSSMSGVLVQDGLVIFLGV